MRADVSRLRSLKTRRSDESAHRRPALIRGDAACPASVLESGDIYLGIIEAPKCWAGTEDW